MEPIVIFTCVHLGVSHHLKPWMFFSFLISWHHNVRSAKFKGSSRVLLLCNIDIIQSQVGKISQKKDFVSKLKYLKSFWLEFFKVDKWNVKYKISSLQKCFYSSPTLIAPKHNPQGQTEGEHTFFFPYQQPTPPKDMHRAFFFLSFSKPVPIFP